MYERGCTGSNTHRRAGLRHKHQRSEAEEQRAQRSHPAESRELAPHRRLGLLYPLLPPQRLIPANRTPNLLILIIDLVNKGKMSNPLKYEPCLERLEPQNTTMKYSKRVSWPAGWPKTKQPKQNKNILLPPWPNAVTFLEFFSPLPISMHLFHFLHILSFILDDRCKL